MGPFSGTASMYVGASAIRQECSACVKYVLQSKTAACPSRCVYPLLVLFGRFLAQIGNQDPERGNALTMF